MPAGRGHVLIDAVAAMTFRVGDGPLLSESTLKIFVAFAVGGLLGDAFLHLIPHAMNPHSHAVAAPALADIAGASWLPQVHSAGFGGVSGLHAAHHHTDDHAHEHDHEHERGHAHGHSHSHEDEPVATKQPLKFGAGAAAEHGHAHGHAHAHEEEERGHAHGHAHSHEATPMKATPTKEHGHSAHSHSHEATPVKEQGRAHDHAHSHSAHDSHSHDSHEGHDHSASTNVGLFILAGMFAFFTIEKAARAHTGGSGGHGHSHGGAHSHEAKHSKSPSANLPKSAAFAFGDDAEEEEDEAKSGLRSRAGKGAASAKPAAKAGVVVAAPAPTADQRITGLLNLIGDFSHNFTDGMALSASYLAGGGVGLSTTLAVLIHEVPHEIGDFAILIQSGFTVQAALKAQLLTALGAVAGCAFGYYSGADEGSTQSSWILPFTAGGFIYVALVNVMPTLLPHQSLRQTLAEMVAMGLGVSLMIAIAAFE